MTERVGETWQFATKHPSADRIFLVHQTAGGGSTWMEMIPAGGGHWELTQQLAPGQHRFHYFVNEGGAYYNCGTDGLLAHRLTGHNPDVHVDPVDTAMTA